MNYNINNYDKVAYYVLIKVPETFRYPNCFMMFVFNIEDDMHEVKAAAIQDNTNYKINQPKK